MTLLLENCVTKTDDNMQLSSSFITKNKIQTLYFDKTIHNYLPLGFIKKNAHINNIYCLSHG
jgi:hypothetical protein